MRFPFQLLFLIPVLFYAKDALPQTAVHRYSQEVWALDFNEEPTSLHRRATTGRDSGLYVYSSVADSTGKLQYLFCNNWYKTGGVRDTLGNRYYHYKGGESFQYGISVAPEQLLLMGYDTMLLVNRNDVTDVKKMFFRKTFSWIHNVCVRKFEDTCYIVQASFDSLYFFKAAKDYVSPLHSFSIHDWFEELKSDPPVVNYKYLHVHVDFNHSMHQISLVLKRHRDDSTESVWALADFNPRKLAISNTQILHRGLTVERFGAVSRDEPLIEQALFAPNDSSLYFVEEHIWYDPQDGRASNVEYEKVKRLHLYPRREVVIEDFVEDLPQGEYNYQGATLYRAANNKIYYFMFKGWDFDRDMMEISYPDKEDDAIEVHAKYNESRSYLYNSSELNYYEPFVQARMVKRCPQPVFHTSHYQQPDSVLWQLYTHGDSQLVATGHGERFSPQIPQRGTYIMRITHYRKGFAQYLWQKYELEAPLQANIELSDTASCQYNALSLKNTSVFDATAPKTITWQWQVTYQSGAVFTQNGFEPEIKPTEKGAHVLSLIASNQHCSDTAHSTSIHILKANPAGFSLSQKDPCLYHKLIIKSDSVGPLVDSLQFYWNQQLTSKESSFEYQPKRAGIHYLGQKVYSKGGCVTEAKDTIQIKHGFDARDSHYMQFITVSADSSISLHFSALPHGSHRYLYENQERIDSITALATAYVHEPVAVTRVGRYNVENVDSCATRYHSEVHQNVVLGFRNQNNQLLVFDWNKYKGWLTGSNFYRLSYSATMAEWYTLGEVSTTNYSLNTNLLEPYDSVYVKIVAGTTERPYQSQSNVVLVDVRNTLFIPNAFSPNGDGINDTFALGHFGYTSFECRVFAKNGQLVGYSRDPVKIWDGKGTDGGAYPVGRYTYIIKAVSQSDEPFTYTGSVYLIR